MTGNCNASNTDIFLRMDLKIKKRTNKNLNKNIFLFSCRTILYWTIGSEKKNFTSFLVVIKLFIKKARILLFIVYLFCCFLNPFPEELAKMFININITIFVFKSLCHYIVSVREDTNKKKDFTLPTLMS